MLTEMTIYLYRMKKKDVINHTPVHSLKLFNLMRNLTLEDCKGSFCTMKCAYSPYQFDWYMTIVSHQGKKHENIKGKRI